MAHSNTPIKPSYRRGVAFIALNLDVGETAEDARDDVSIITLSEAFGKPIAEVVRDVFRMKRNNKEVAP